MGEAEPELIEQSQAGPGVKPAPPVKVNSAAAHPLVSEGTEPAKRKVAEPALAVRRSQTAARGAESIEKKVAETDAPKGGSRTGPTSTQRVPAVAGRRDPFRLPGPPAPAGEADPLRAMGPLPPGARGLIISQLRLEGIVRKESTQTMIAVVANSSNRAYFLRERDGVYDGVVSKITPDAVYFRENIADMNGRLSSREVVKRLGPALGGAK